MMTLSGMKYHWTVRSANEFSFFCLFLPSFRFGACLPACPCGSHLCYSALSHYASLPFLLPHIHEFWNRHIRSPSSSHLCIIRHHQTGQVSFVPPPPASIHFPLFMLYMMQDGGRGGRRRRRRAMMVPDVLSWLSDCFSFHCVTML